MVENEGMGKAGEGQWEVQASTYELVTKHREYSQWYYTQEHGMVAGASYTCGEHSITYRLVESLCCTPETNTIFCVNYTSIKKKSLKKKSSSFQLEGR